VIFLCMALGLLASVANEARPDAAVPLRAK
jgi:hypothetical protein